LLPSNGESPLKVYISIPLTGLEGDARNYVLLLAENIKEVCESLGFEVYLPHKRYDPKMNPRATPAEVFLGDLKALSEADLVIMYLGKKSNGVGMEHQVAFEWVKPIIALVEKGVGVTRILMGEPARRSIIEFTTDDIESFKKELINLLKRMKPELFRQRSFDHEIRTWLRSIGEKIRKLRERRGMSRKDLEERSGVPEDYIKYIEEMANVVYPSLQVLSRIAKALGTSSEFIVSPNFAPDDLSDFEIVRDVKSFAHENNIPYREYEELLATCLLMSRQGGSEGRLKKEDIAKIYHRMKGC
jgi:transcriptional regulator with XRE-family HTH domain/nucleoside 2-deoxyribosyltransferase